MIIFTDTKKIFFYLLNPKCGSFTFFNIILPQIMKKYKIIYTAKNEYTKGFDDYSYYHCNLKAAVTFLQEQNIDPSNVIFITTIREPIDRFISAYFYDLKYHKIEKIFNNSINISQDFERYVKENSFYINFTPDKFRIHENFKINNIIRLEYFKDDFEKICKIYNLDLDCSKLENTFLNKSNRKDLDISDDIKSYIIKKFELDYVDGLYTL